MVRTRLIIGALAALSAAAADVSSADFYDAIRRDDITALKGMLAKGNANIADRRGATPLMHAAAIGSAEAVKTLLAAGADVKAKNAFEVTALVWASGDFEKARLLIEAGADVNARSKQGQTALITAAASAGNVETVRLLLSKGANVKVDGGAALMGAAAANDAAIVRLLIENGADAKAADRAGNTALMGAASGNHVANVKLLLDNRADVNAASTEGGQVKNGAIALKQLTPLLMSAAFGSTDLVETLLDAGAQVNAKDVRGMTPLMLGVASETQNAEVVKLLVAEGADLNAKSNAGETVLDWALRFGDPKVIRILKDAGAKTAAENPKVPQPNATRFEEKKAVEAGIALLQRSVTEFFKQSGCVACHHQNLTAIAVTAARQKGIRVDEAAAAEHQRTVKFFLTGVLDFLLQRIDLPGAPDIALYSLTGLAAEGYAADSITDAVALNVAMQQRDDGSWSVGGVSRAPIEESNIARTVMGIRALRTYGAPALRRGFERRIERARIWLAAAKPRTTDDHAMLVRGLKLIGMDNAVPAAAAKLLTLQRADGGWAGNPNLESDAFATGEALVVLHESGALRPNDAAWTRGVEYLLKTQRPDGSWYMKSRAPKFQPYFESGSPYGHDQWISAAATAWAATAIASGLEK